jgi:bifunctional non-homologous end joining protein LigD
LKLRQNLPKPFLESESDTGSTTGSNPKTLETYRRKRNFSKTPEPPASTRQPKRRGNQRRFVVQKHRASRLHYDFRLEIAGALKSWAVPKGPPYDLHERRLAMATEDHPMEYAGFEGLIPKGEYGGGTVMVWDTGTYELLDGNYWKGKLHFALDGKKLKGEWVLVKGQEQNGKDNAWYLIKTGASIARLSEKKENSSALTGRSMEQIAKAEDAVWHSNKNGREDSPGPKRKLVDLESLPEAAVRFIEPMLAQPMPELPVDHRKWLYEIKLDGYRCLVGKNSSKITLWSRRGNLLTKQFPRIARSGKALAPGTLLDGEIVALDEAGRPSFNLLQHHRSKAQSIKFYAFDILVYRGRSVVGLALENRRELLREALSAAEDPIRLSEAFETPLSELVRAAKEHSMEGIVAKQKDSMYEPGKRTGAWLKYRINRGQEFVIGGYTPDHPFDALIVGYYEGDKLYFVAKVRNGFVPQLRREVYGKFKGLEVESCPFINLPEKRRTQWALTAEEMKSCMWLRPELVAQIEFAEWTPDGHLRHAKFVGLRDDKDVRTVVREQF